MLKLIMLVINNKMSILKFPKLLRHEYLNYSPIWKSYLQPTTNKRLPS